MPLWKDNRVSLYVRPKKDKDIRDELKEVLGEDASSGDISEEIRNLIRDGMKYRKGAVGITQPKKPEPVKVKETPKLRKPDFSGLDLKEKEVNINELESRLDNF